MSLPWLQSQWIVDFAFSIDNTLTFSEKFEERHWHAEDYEYQHDSGCIPQNINSETLGTQV